MKNIQLVEETNLGVYVWEMPDGKWVADDEGHFMLIQSEKNNVSKIKLLTDAARHYGITGGKPRFLAGNRPVDDEEYDNQKRRASFGLVPDEYDVSALKEDAWAKQQ